MIANTTILSRLLSCSGIAPRVYMISRYSSSTRKGGLYCTVDAEPLERYRRGGYHPTHLGDTFHRGQYKIIHKLGWGGYGTVWLAEDLLLRRYVALKLTVSEIFHLQHEVHVLDRLSQGIASHPGKKHIVQLLDRFQHEGPNGTHSCLVLELLGPRVDNEAERHDDNRLPGSIAWETCKQTAQAVEYVHANGIAHGDIHPGNFVFAPVSTVSELGSNIMKLLGTPQVGDVQAMHGVPLTLQAPKYLVAPVSLPPPKNLQECSVKLVDFGNANLSWQKHEMRCPLVFRAPEAVLDSEGGIKADIWSLACTMFELVVGYPPFDNLMPNKDDLIREWVSMLGNLPQKWAHHFPCSESDDIQIDQVTLPDWLHDTYFDEGRKRDFAEAHIEELGELLQSMMQYCPSNRPRVSELLKRPWFQKNPWQRLPPSKVSESSPSMA